jgi:phenylacetyl-CoA:acceptor oxidoreductase subunit 1
MTRWAMVVDLRRCVGCQTCTAACKHANATPPGVQWRRVLDMEFGQYPEVQRAFVPVGCQHCEDPPCLDVCPTTATRKRADGIVTIVYDLCIGCAYCAVACPYQARYKTDVATFAYGQANAAETQRADAARLAVATKCTFCVDRIDAGLAQGLQPGVDPEATPACVNACIAQAMSFGDRDDPQSKVSQQLRDNQHFRMHEDLGTGPGMHYIWDGPPAPAATQDPP